MENCNCASFFTVRGKHKNDCPAQEHIEEESWGSEAILRDMLDSFHGVAEWNKKESINLFIEAIKRERQQAKESVIKEIEEFIDKNIQLFFRENTNEFIAVEYLKQFLNSLKS